jgi:hypothetical protein
MRPYIKGGTPVGNDSLCRTCSYAHIMRGYRESEMVTICNEVHPNVVVPFSIFDCSGYYDKNRPTWEQMEKLAIHVSAGPLKPVGFKVSGAGFLADAQAVEDDETEEQEGEEEEEETFALNNTRGRLL